MPYRVVNGKLQYVADSGQTGQPSMAATPTDGTMLERQAEIERRNAEIVNSGTAPVTRTVTTPQEQAAQGAAQNVAPVPSYQQTHVDVTQPTAPKTQDERIEGISGARNLEEALAAARDEADRETQVRKRLANKAYWDSIASTVGALGKFAVVGTQKDGRDVQTGDAASGSRKAYDEAVKRRDVARAKLEALEKEGRAYKQTMDQLSKKFENQRELARLANLSKEELAMLRHGYDMEAILARRDAGIVRDNNASQNRLGEIDARNKGQQTVVGMRNEQQNKNNEQKAEEAEKTRQHQAEQKEKDRQSAERRAGMGGRSIVIRGGTGVGGAGGGSASGGGASGSSSSGGSGGKGKNFTREADEKNKKKGKKNLS